MKTKISYFLSHPIQYFSPLLREMAKEFDLQVYYFSDASIKGNLDVGFSQAVKWDIPMLEGYAYRFLKNISGRKSLSNRMWDVVNPSVVKTVYKAKSKIILVNGWSYFSTLLTIFSAKIFGKQVWLRAENPLNQELQKGKYVLLAKKILLKYFLFLFVDKFLYIGSESKKFFEFYGVKPGKLVYTPYAVDNNLFRQQYLQYQDKTQIRNELQLPLEKTIFLFTGKYIEKKRPIDLLQAFHELKNESALLIMVGEGRLRKDMEMFISANNCKNVLLTGFVNQSEIARYYAAADVFVMCSGIGETWGLSVNEAMNFALPVIVSATTGCSADLVQHGVNGFVFEQGNIEALRSYMEKFIGNPAMTEAAGLSSQSIIADFSIGKIVHNMQLASA